MVSSLTSGQSVTEGTDVNFACSSDVDSVLTLWSDAGNTKAQQATTNGTSLEVTVSLTKSLNQTMIFCQAARLDMEVDITSEESYSFNVIGKSCVPT